jgi:putative ABC transport system ATP-binding protein
MIRLDNVTKTFPSAGGVKLFDHLNLELSKGKFTVVIGSNGSGKSTLLNLIAGTVFPESGSILLEGNDIKSLKDYERSRWIARIFQNPLAGTAPDLTILENFRLASIRSHKKKFTIGTGEKFRQVVKEKISVLNLGLENKIDQKVGNLSGGQRQSLTLLMAIADETKLLLLDEPTAALDPKTSDLVMGITDHVIRDYNLTALLVTHQLKDVVLYGDRIIQLKEGRILRDILKNTGTTLTLPEVYQWFE